MDWHGIGYPEFVSLVYIWVLVDCYNKVSPKMLAGLEKS